jgi:hypothetical protein
MLLVQTKIGPSTIEAIGLFADEFIAKVVGQTPLLCGSSLIAGGPFSGRACIWRNRFIVTSDHSLLYEVIRPLLEAIDPTVVEPDQ